MQYEEEWAIQSLFATLGLIGGLSGIIWGTLEVCFGGYGSFKFENSLIAAVYPTSPGNSRTDGDYGMAETEE